MCVCNCGCGGRCRTGLEGWGTEGGNGEDGRHLKGPHRSAPTVHCRPFPLGYPSPPLGIPTPIWGRKEEEEYRWLWATGGGQRRRRWRGGPWRGGHRSPPSRTPPAPSATPSIKGACPSAHRNLGGSAERLFTSPVKFQQMPEAAQFTAQSAWKRSIGRSGTSHSDKMEFQWQAHGDPAEKEGKQIDIRTPSKRTTRRTQGQKRRSRQARACAWAWSWTGTGWAWSWTGGTGTG